MINCYILILLIGLFFQFSFLSNLTSSLKILKPFIFPIIIWYFLKNQTNTLIEINQIQKNILYGITLSFSLGSIFSFRERNKKNIDFLIFFYFLLSILITLETNLFYIFIKFELLTILGAALIIIENEIFNYKIFKEVAIKYFLTHCFAGVLFLIGIGYASINNSNLDIYIMQTQYLNIGHYFIIASLIINSAVPLFSFWLTQGYSTTRFSTSFIMFPVVTKISIFFLFVICGQVKNLEFLKIIGLVTMLYGSILTLCEMNIRKFLAYATISHNGLFFLFISQFNDISFYESSKIFDILMITSIISQNILLSVILTITQNAKSYFFLDIEKNIKKYKFLFILTIVGNAIFIGLPYTSSFEIKNLIFDKIHYPWKKIIYLIIVINIFSHMFVLPYRIFKNKEITFSSNSFSFIDYIKNLSTTLIPITLSIILTNKYFVTFEQTNKYLQFIMSSCIIFIIFHKIIPSNRNIILDFDFIFYHFKKFLNAIFVGCKQISENIVKKVEIIKIQFLAHQNKKHIINIYNAATISILCYLIFFVTNYRSYH